MGQLQPLTAAALRGKVVAVQFGTYSCINWIRTLPYVRAWARAYRDRGLVVVGAQTPEFGFEQEIGGVRRALAAMGVEYPVVLDNAYAIWSAFENRYWPALYVLDGEGSVRYHHFGEGAYEESETIIRGLLGVDGDRVHAEESGIELAADWDSLRSPETYVGSARGERRARDGAARAGAEPVGAVRRVGGRRRVGRARGRRRIDHVPLRGPRPQPRPDAAGLRRRRPLRGAPRRGGPRRGARRRRRRAGAGTVDEPRLYQLVRQPDAGVDRTFEISFLDPGVRAYVFTFG